MTFYWWSHWFWITLMGSTLLSTFVQTYPSQEIKNNDDEYNQNNSKSVTTKLFQTSTTQLLWAITTPPTTMSTQIMDLTQSVAQTRESSESTSIEKEAAPIEYEEIEALEIETGKNEIPKPKDDATYMDENSEDYEFKRSAEIDQNSHTKTAHKIPELKIETTAAKQKSNSNDTQDNKSAIVKLQINRKPTITIAEDDSVISKIISNNNDKAAADKNASINFSNISTNSPTNVNITTSSATPMLSTSNSSAPPSAPAAPQIDSDMAAAEWLHTAIVPPPAVSQPNLDDISSNLVTTASVAQKVAFTLENANKEDELRRAESEHRSRKSKVLNGDYKQINRYINYSSDPKSLLTRSASTAPNEFNGDNESNISSEALAIQRTYFLDAGSISAICFTVFGICCTVGTIGIVLYRRRYLNKPQTLSEPDSSVYIDDSTMRVSDNSDEMYSLDNDSFLNSLEAMTIQNYWTDTVKHTKL